MAQKIDFKQGIQHFINVLTKQFISHDGRMSQLDFTVFIIPALLVEYLLLWTGIIYLIFLIPTGCAAARRLHDLGMSGWIALVMIFPLLNVILSIFLALQEGQKEKNTFGEVPADTCKIFSE